MEKQTNQAANTTGIKVNRIKIAPELQRAIGASYERGRARSLSVIKRGAFSVPAKKTK